MEEEVKFQTTFGLLKPAWIMTGIFLVFTWFVFSVSYWADYKTHGWLPYVLGLIIILVLLYGCGLLLTNGLRETFNSIREWSREQEEEDEKERNDLLDLVVKKFHPNSIGFDKEANLPTVTFEVGGKVRTICKMGDTYYEVVDLDKL